MNLAESVKFVIKNKSPKIFGSLIKQDLKNLLKETPANLIELTKSIDLGESLKDAKESIQGTALLLKVIPRRINNGLKNFGEDLVNELDQLPDQKQRTVFFMKVLASLSRFALSSAYDIGLGEVKLLGIGKGKIVYSRLIAAKIFYKLIQVFIVRLIEEIEKEVDNVDEIEKLKNLKILVLDNSGNAIDKFFDGVIDPNEKAYQIVEKFKKYVFSGERA
jgi:hypothetical protein